MGVSVTGGTLYSDATYYYRVFTGTSTCSVSGTINMDFVIVAGGGGGGCDDGGGGGAGGFQVLTSQSISAGTFNVVVGGGGTSGAQGNISTSGNNSSFGALNASVGGGRGATYSATAALTGGSGGGGSGWNGQATGASGTTGQGTRGGNGASGAWGSGGGGGGSGVGGNGLSRVSGTYYFSGGGGGGSPYNVSAFGAGGSGGGGRGQSSNAAAVGGITNTGGGGGGAWGGAASGVGAAGGSGIVIVRYLIADAIVTLNVTGQSSANIKQVYPTYAQSSANIKTVTFSVSAVNALIIERYGLRVKNDGPISWWRLDENTGDTVVIDYIDGRNASTTGTVTKGSTALTNKGSKAYTIENGYVNLGTSYNFTGRLPFTWVIWTYPTSLDQLYRAIMSQEHTIFNSRQGFTITQFYHSTLTDMRGIFVSRYVGGSEIQFPPPGTGAEGGYMPISNNSLNYVVAGYDGTNVFLFVNGNFISIADTRTMGLINVPLAAGGASVIYNSFLGRIDEVSVYNKALSYDSIVDQWMIGQGLNPVRYGLSLAFIKVTSKVYGQSIALIVYKQTFFSLSQTKILNINIETNINYGLSNALIYISIFLSPVSDTSNSGWLRVVR